MSTTDNPEVRQAKAILQGQPSTVDDMNRLVEALAHEAARIRTGAQGQSPTPDQESARARNLLNLSRQLMVRACVTDAKEILNGKHADPKYMLVLAKKLKSGKEFGYARQVLAHANERVAARAEPALALEIGQQRALCTYKDLSSPEEDQLDQALDILDRADPLATASNAETLGIAGAICKNKWQRDRQKHHLESSLEYYRRGYGKEDQHGNPQRAEDDYGYTSINAAFVLDLLADLDEASHLVKQRRQQAQTIRGHLTRVLPPLAAPTAKPGLNNEWWFLVTIAEAYFGLRDYVNATEWLQRATALPEVPDWEVESTARQLTGLAQLQEAADRRAGGGNSAQAWQVLKQCLGLHETTCRALLLGKVGLALSGGGFRASLFHIGVLACLAELDLLRHVEVLSCVSGGSIVGAHYYLELRKELHDPSKGGRIDYLAIVERVARDFLVGVQRNIRTRVLTEFKVHLRRIRSNDALTRRIGELLEEEIYSRVLDGEGPERWLNTLRVEPADGPDNFNPKYDNWRREAKVPILILNATTLSTSHNWQFTASWMGEPPATVDTEVDTNERLRRLYYGEAPQGYQQMRLGHAVAASACVPGIFEPLELPGLYPHRTPRLVDGGVHDNQGIVGLLEQGCSVLLVSDASGPLDARADSGGGRLAVLFRSLDLLMTRVRDAQYHDLKKRRYFNLLRSLMFVDLKKCLAADPVNWCHCGCPHRSIPRGLLTPYGISTEVQEQLAAIRTDLDSFSDVEAFALMTSGYRMTQYELRPGSPCSQLLRDVIATPAALPRWRFLDIEWLMKSSRGTHPESDRMMQLLDAAKCRTFKAWHLAWQLRWLGRALGAIAVVGLTSACFCWPVPMLLLLALLGLTATGGAIIYLAEKVAPQLAAVRKIVTRGIAAVAMSTLGNLCARLHLATFDQWYLRRGKP